MKIILFVSCCLLTMTTRAQQLTASGLTARKKSKVSHHSTNSMTAQSGKNADAHQKQNTLFQYGVANSFAGGLFEATLPMSELKKQGNFGLGAPGLIDGELTIYNGHAFQTRATGETTEVPDTFKTALAFVTFFKADTTFHISAASNQKEAFEHIEKYLHKKNAAYAIKISGNFDHLKTRAFHPYTKKPFPPLATLLNTQKIFDINHTKGMILGYKLPSYLNGISVAGYHFHFLSDNRTQGGHVLDFAGEDLTVEVAQIQNFLLSIPQDDDFMNYQFKSEDNAGLEKVEKGH
jgi:acetolactate decarboxylase